ncbi:MAG: 23S rRNA (uracil(1939)-C(5))-methyltransferase RlmD [Clostridiales bacterium]|jgi:23S rRNA (uracil1939-C5)-methyltransferase|nr:23S rRNA (uracil(1939)-C(5))-methyltransferase RlmD [Clostridiales bacterium]
MKLLKNSRHTIEIIDVTEKGFGVGEIDGFVVFIDGALPGDVIDTLIIKIKKKYAYGKIIQIKTPSAFRIKSNCPVSHSCGGCQWQHCEYEAQLKFKKQIVKSALEKIGGLIDPPVFDVIGTNKPARYRNKAVFPIVPAKNTDGFAIGMFAARSHRIVQVSDCAIQHEAHIEILSAVKTHMRRHKITAYDETTHKGIMRHTVVRTSFETGEIMVVLVANGKIPKRAELTAALVELGASTVLVNKNTMKNNTIMSDEFQILHGEGFIREKIGEVEYQLSAPSFFQINPVQTKILYETAIAQAELDGSQIVIDAHAGVGGVALFTAKHAKGAKKIIGVDIVQSAVYDAQKNSALNGIENAEFICGAAEEVIPKLMQSSESKPDVVFLDPPRKGCDSVLLDALIAAEIKKIIYISCDPATLARDIKHLTQNGSYKLTAAQPVDMFPFTGKIEVCCNLGAVK